jgi:hypothetical protein
MRAGLYALLLAACGADVHPTTDAGVDAQTDAPTWDPDGYWPVGFTCTGSGANPRMIEASYLEVVGLTLHYGGPRCGGACAIHEATRVTPSCLEVPAAVEDGFARSVYRLCARGDDVAATIVWPRMTCEMVGAR